MRKQICFIKRTNYFQQKLRIKLFSIKKFLYLNTCNLKNNLALLFHGTFEIQNLLTIATIDCRIINSF